MDADTTQEFDREEILQALRETRAEIAEVRRAVDEIRRGGWLRDFIRRVVRRVGGIIASELDSD